ncbi:sialidase family protein [Streptomyces sp. NPDC002838]|uniref:sialidase family protein n=1 Tax=Streptomyces sp. NPDC002838 TaxID=3154436 RepID=UPI0033218B58
MAVVTRGRARTALLTALVLAVLTGVLLPGPASAEGTSGEASAYINTATEGDGPRTPDIIGTSANNAVVAWREGIVPGKVDQGYIRYSYTTDGGVNWSRPKILAQETSEYSWHYVVLYQAGHELFAYLGRTKTSITNNNGLPIDAVVVKRSTDEGHTWQDYPTTIPYDDPDTTGVDEGFANLIIAGRPVQLAGGKHVIPFWASGRENGVLISSDLKTWTAGGVVPDPNDLDGGEPQIAVSQDDPNKLVMVARSAASRTRAATATSSDGGQTWTPFMLDSNLPSYDVKVQFTKDSNGQYLSIHNTAKDRKVLNYKVKRPGAAWSAGKFFADGPAADEDKTPVGTGAGWDTYAMADEYAPGKFYVAWEFDTSRIKVNKLDTSDAP